MSLSQTIVFNKKDAEIFKRDKCDKYDYLIAVGCGAIGGIVDVFLVGAPKDSVLGNWTDKQSDKFVMFFAKKNGWKPREGKESSIESAIGFLEKKYQVNYDQRHSGDVGDAFNMSTKNHHMKSLSHSPSIIGLFFSILNQFASTSSFISGGQLITINTETFELQGSNLISKLFCGVANWFGHIISDMAGSSGGRGSGVRGSGVGIPFFELFQFCTIGSFQVGKDRQDLATIATRAFQEGYDMRHGAAMAIPVMLTELIIRLLWGVKRYFYHKVPLKQCIPTREHTDLRIMIIIGQGTLCTIDGIDAGIRSGGVNAVTFFLRFNIVAWTRFTMLVLTEVFIRLGISADIEAHLESYRRINEQLQIYLSELEKIDAERFRKEADNYDSFVESVSSIKNENDLNTLLLDFYDELDKDLPWEGDFSDFMDDDTKALVFK